MRSKVPSHSHPLVQISISHYHALQETRNSLFNHFVDSDGVFAEVEAKFELSLQEAQRSKVKYGFKDQQWLETTHGPKKAAKIMERKARLGLNLVLTCRPTSRPAFMYLVDDLKGSHSKRLERKDHG